MLFRRDVLKSLAVAVALSSAAVRRASAQSSLRSFLVLRTATLPPQGLHVPSRAGGWTITRVDIDRIVASFDNPLPILPSPVLREARRTEFGWALGWVRGLRRSGDSLIADVELAVTGESYIEHARATGVRLCCVPTLQLHDRSDGGLNMTLVDLFFSDDPIQNLPPVT